MNSVQGTESSGRLSQSGKPRGRVACYLAILRVWIVHRKGFLAGVSLRSMLRSARLAWETHPRLVEDQYRRVRLQAALLEELVRQARGQKLLREVLRPRTLRR